MSCNYYSWLDLAYSNGYIVLSTSRFEQIIQELPRPSQQTPAIVFLLGKKRGQKEHALRYLFRHNHTQKNITDGLASFRLDNDTVSSDKPLLCADANLDVKCHPLPTGPGRHRQYPITWPCKGENTAVDFVHARVILPLCHVLMLFADDFESMANIMSRIDAWTRLDGFAGARRLRPRLILVYSATSKKFSVQDIREVCTKVQILGSFSTITAVPLQDASLSPSAYFRPLRERLLHDLDICIEAQRRSHWLLSAIHVKDLCEASIRHNTTRIAEIFDPMVFARRHSRHEGDLSQHLKNFIDAGVKYVNTYSDVTTYVASALFMDAYPPKRHLFPPEEVFDRFYQRACSEAFIRAYDVDSLAERQTKTVRQKFCSHFRQLLEWLRENEQASSADLHMETAKSTSIVWLTVKLEETCIFCLVRMAQYPLTCGHTICDECVRMQGRGLPGKEEYFSVDSCRLCKWGSIRVTLKPPTSGIRLLGIDGGGTRGIIPIEYLRQVQGCLGPECPLPDFIDLVFGTSSGGLTALALSQGWSVEECSETFESTVKQFFTHNAPNAKGLLSKVKVALKALYKDGLYDPDMFEHTLKETLGETRMLEPTGDECSGKKAGVIAASIGTPSAYVLSNYNASGTGEGYVRSSQVAIWEAARATTAAPLLFPTVDLHVGTAQDGGMKHNNPIGIALCESRHIWPKRKLNVVLSLGTGTTEPRIRRASSFRNIGAAFQSLLADGFIDRTVESCMDYFDGEAAWRSLLNQVPDVDKRHYYRFNTKFEGGTPWLGNIDQMQEWRKATSINPNEIRRREKLAVHLLISSFYLKLDQPLVYHGGSYKCEGTIHCQNDSGGVVRALKRRFPQNLDFYLDRGVIGSFSGEEDICKWCQRYKKKVVFYVRDPYVPVEIGLRTRELEDIEIGGFPQTMAWFEEEQRLGASFGTADHGVPHSFSCQRCDRPQNRSG